MINVIRGETKPFAIKVRGEVTGDPHDFTGATEIVVSFPAGSGTIDKKLSLAQIAYPVSPLLGVLAGTLSSTDTPNLDTGSGGNVKVTETKPSGVRIWEGQILNVKD